MAETELQENIAAVRRFNRVYTNRIGLLNQGLAHTPFPLTQARILFELARHEQITASELINELDIDPGYLSRILSSFKKDGFTQTSKSKSDNRHRLLRLTAKGRKAFADLNERTNHEIEALLQGLSAEDQHRLIRAMGTLESLLGEETKPERPYLLRLHEPGDIGWVIHRHGVLYAEEYGFDETFEALVADILVRFIQHHDPKRERLWIAEQDGERIGAVMVVDAGEQVAQLRLLLVEAKARGRGIGKRLIEECIDFSKRTGYKKIKLWTQSLLAEARHLYEKAGFKLVEEKPHQSWGHNLVSEVWELPLKK